MINSRFPHSEQYLYNIMPNMLVIFMQISTCYNLHKLVIVILEFQIIH